MPALGIDIGGSSVKACLIDGEHRRTSQSGLYDDPSREELAGAIRSAVSCLDIADLSIPVGICLPGRRHASGEAIERSVNLPCLNGWRFDDLLGSGLGSNPGGYSVISDAHAAAHDWFCAHHPIGRTAVVAIGTGVGLCVLDGGLPVGIGDGGIGHLGLVDIGRLGDRDTVATNGATNTLESYVGGGTLRARFGVLNAERVAELLIGLDQDDPFMRALVRALRLVHAIYTPDTIVLMGGIGIAMAPRRDELVEPVSTGLTSLARPAWRLCFGDSLFHAASGAALLASASV